MPPDPTTTLVTQLRSGNTRALARAISLVEDQSQQARELLSACFPHTGQALTVGITGPPGAGKSSLVDQLSTHYRAQQTTVGVLAIDPSSPYSGGALLGDRIRMEKHHADPGFYLRSMATRGALGGLARATANAASILDASGKQRILIETVGVGQDELDIVRLADVTLVVLVPGMGDDIQSIKAGILEIADIFVINKSDREGADRVEAELRALQSFAPAHTAWLPPILRTNSLTGEGLPALLAAMNDFHHWLQQDARLAARRTARWKERLAWMVRDELLQTLRITALSDELLQAHAAKIVSGEEDPYTCVLKMVTNISSGHNARSGHPNPASHQSVL